MNKGIKKEFEFVNYINNKKINELNENMKGFLKFIFDNIEEEDIIKCEKIMSKDKSDVKITYKDESKCVSLKSGNGVSVHTESINHFVVFLKNININEKIINYFLLYFYGDSTINGCGQVRFSAEEAIDRYKKEISIFNKYVNHNNIIVSFSRRVLFEGLERNNCADYIYYGDVVNGLWASKEEIINYLISNKCMDIITPHFSCLTCQNWCRNIVYNKKMESHRYYIQVKWHSIKTDLKKIRDKNNKE